MKTRKSSATPEFRKQWDDALRQFSGKMPDVSAAAVRLRIAGLVGGVDETAIENAIVATGRQATADSLLAAIVFVWPLMLDLSRREDGVANALSFDAINDQFEQILLEYRARRNDPALAIYESALQVALKTLIRELSAYELRKAGSNKQPQLVEDLSGMTWDRLQRGKANGGEWLAGWDPAHIPPRSAANWVRYVVTSEADGLRGITGRVADDSEERIQEQAAESGGVTPLRAENLTKWLVRFGTELPGQIHTVTVNGTTRTIKYTANHKVVWYAYLAVSKEYDALIDVTAQKVANHLGKSLAWVKRCLDDCFDILPQHPKFADLIELMIPYRYSEHSLEDGYKTLKQSALNLMKGTGSGHEGSDEGGAYNRKAFRDLVHQCVAAQAVS